MSIHHHNAAIGVLNSANDSRTVTICFLLQKFLTLIGLATENCDSGLPSPRNDYHWIYGRVVVSACKYILCLGPRHGKILHLSNLTGHSAAI